VGYFATATLMVIRIAFDWKERKRNCIGSEKGVLPTSIEEKGSTGAQAPNAPSSSEVNFRSQLGSGQ